MSSRNIHPRSTHPSGLQHIFHAASCRSVGTTKRGHYLVSILYVWYKNYQYQQVLFITYSHHLSPPLHRWFLGPNFPTARNSAGVMFSKRTSWRSSWWSHPIAYVDCPSLRIKDGNWNNTNQEVSLSNMGGPLYHVSLSKDVCLTGQHLLHTTFPIYISGTVQDTFLFSVPLMSP